MAVTIEGQRLIGLYYSMGRKLLPYAHEYEWVSRYLTSFFWGGAMVLDHINSNNSPLQQFLGQVTWLAGNIQILLSLRKAGGYLKGMPAENCYINLQVTE